MENVVGKTMINERFAEMMQSDPFVAAQFDGYHDCQDKGAFTVAALVKEGEIDKALTRFT